MTEEQQVEVIDIVTEPNPDGKVYAVARGVQRPVHPKSFVIDGDMSTMTEIADSKPVTIGENIRCEIPAHLRERALRPYTTATFYADTVGENIEPPAHKRLGMLSTPIFPMGADFPPQIFRPTRVPIPASIERDQLPSTMTIARSSMLVVQRDPQLHGVVVGMEFEAKFLCGTCQATGKVGEDDFAMTCPACDGTKIAKFERDGGRRAVDHLLCDDVRVGTNSQFMNSQSIPVTALGKGSMETDAILPGLLLTISLSNTSRLPIRFGGKVFFAPPPPMPKREPFVEGNDALAREVPAPTPNEPEADCA